MLWSVKQASGLVSARLGSEEGAGGGQAAAPPGRGMWDSHPLSNMQEW